MNTRIIPVEYNYVAPQTLAEALNLLAKKKDVAVMAGGTDLVVKLKTGAETEMKTMLDIKRIPELEGITVNADSVAVGATTKLADIEDNEVIKEKYVALYEALKAMAAIAVRHMGTIGGNFANASPVADTAGPVMVYGGTVKLVSAKGERTVPATEFFKGPGVSAKEYDELITEITLPVPPANSGAAFTKKTRVKADISKVSNTIYLEREGNKISALKIAMGAVAATPIMLNDVAAKYVGKEGTEATFAAIAADAAAAIKPIDDVRSTAEYRKMVAKVIIADNLALAWKRAGGAE